MVFLLDLGGGVEVDDGSFLFYWRVLAFDGSFLFYRRVLAFLHNIVCHIFYIRSANKCFPFKSDYFDYSTADITIYRSASNA